MKKLSEEQVRQLFPHFSSISEIATGGFKTVYDADVGESREALKVVSIPDGDGALDEQKYRDECVGRIKREVALLNECSTPFLVRTASQPITHHKVEGSDFVTYSEEFLEGANLLEVARSGGDLPSEREVKLLLKCLFQCIRELWKRGVVHRDVKPLNIIKTIYPERPFVLIDLGIAFALHDTALTHQASMRNPIATYRYIAPEQCDPRKRLSLDYRCDLYSAALTAFEYATNVHPIAQEHDDMMRTVARALNDKPKDLSDIRPDFSKDFCRLVGQLLKKRPALRPANIEYLISKMEK